MKTKFDLSSIKIERFDPLNASEKGWVNYHEYRKIRHMETNPEDPFPGDKAATELMKKNAENPEFAIYFFAILDTTINKQVGEVLQAITRETSPSYEGTGHLLQFDIHLIQAYRRKGIGTMALKQVYDFAIAQEKKVLITGTDEADGRAFLKVIGAQEALAGVENRLKLENVDWEMVKKWAKEGPIRSPNTILESFYSPSEEIIEEFCKVYTEVLNQQPLGELDVGAIVITPEVYRKQEKMYGDLGRTWLTMITREADGAISGLTEMRYNPEKETMISQLLTGVKEEYRGRGLGKWLKASMLLRVGEEFPRVKIVTTGNASSNEAMLSINNRLGFEVYKESVNGQITVEALGQYLANK